MTFTRYAIYFAPPAEAEWSRFAAHWLGWDMERGCRLTQPEFRGWICKRSPKYHANTGCMRP